MLRATQVPPKFELVLEYGAITLYGRAFQLSSTNCSRSFFLNPSNENTICIVPSFGGLSGGPTTPIGMPTGLGSSAFARRYLRNLFDFFSSAYLDVSVQLVPSSQPMYSAMSDQTLLWPGFPIRISPDQHFCAAPRSVSPLTRPSSATCP